MRRADDLARLIALRDKRVERAALLVARRSAECAEAGEKVEAASAAAAAHGERRVEKEERLFDRMAMRPLTPHEIGRAHDILQRLDFEAQDLDRDEQDAMRGLEEARRRREAAAAERLALERRRDKLTAFDDARRRTAVRRAELVAELDADDGARRPRRAP